MKSVNISAHKGNVAVDVSILQGDLMGPAPSSIRTTLLRTRGACQWPATYVFASHWLLLAILVDQCASFAFPC